MKKKRHKPPSRIRYEKNNPVISFRIKKELYNEFKAFLKDQELSIGDFFRIALKKQKATYKRADTGGYNRGYNDGKNNGAKTAISIWRIWYYCKICGEMIYITPNSDPHKALINYMKEKGWGHAKCHNKKSLDKY